MERFLWKSGRRDSELPLRGPTPWGSLSGAGCALRCTWLGEPSSSPVLGPGTWAGVGGVAGVLSRGCRAEAPTQEPPRAEQAASGSQQPEDDARSPAASCRRGSALWALVVVCLCHVVPWSLPSVAPWGEGRLEEEMSPGSLRSLESEPFDQIQGLCCPFRPSLLTSQIPSAHCRACPRVTWSSS